jgi:hypothetical protein
VEGAGAVERFEASNFREDGVVKVGWHRRVVVLVA